MNRGSLYEDDDDDVDDEDEDDIGEDLEDIRRACMLPEANSDEATTKTGSVGEDGGGGGEIPSDSENEDDFEMLRGIKSQLASSNDVGSCDGPPTGLSVPSDLNSESEDDFEILRNIKSQLAMSMDVRVGLSDDDEDDAFETLRAIRRRFSAFDSEGNIMNDSHGKKKQVHASDNEPSSEILSRSNTCESFPDNGKSVPDSEEAHERTCQSSLFPAASSSSSFPESAQAFVDAIRKNRSYQKFLREKLSVIEATIEKNEKHMQNVKIVKDFQADCKRKTKLALSQKKDPRVELISTRKPGPSNSSEDNDKKISPLTFGPGENAHVANYRMALEKYPISVDRRSWSKEENENLVRGLKQQIQRRLVTEAIERSSDLEGSTDDKTICESIKNLEITPEMIRQFLPKVNWEELGSMMKDRSAAECEARWLSSEDPLINHGPWTAEEDEYLRLIIQEERFTDWLDVAVSLGTNRTPFQCLARYQRTFNPDMLKTEWTAEEDEQLRAAVELFGEQDWQSVANALGGRTGPQCSNRWKKSTDPTIKKGRWSAEEDKRLKVAVMLFGVKNFNKIAKFVPLRTQVQCRERWEILDPKVKRGAWTEEEDEKLIELAREHKYSWTKVATHLSGRTDNQCSRRWRRLCPHEAALLRKAKNLQKQGIVGNFVDRESERPALADVLALPEIPLEPEPVLKEKRRARREKKSSAERQPKRRRKGLEKSSGDVCRIEDETSVCEKEAVNGGEEMLLECHNEIQDDNNNVKEKKKQRRRRKSVAETSNNRSQVKIGNERKASAVVPIENQDAAPNQAFYSSLENFDN